MEIGDHILLTQMEIYSFKKFTKQHFYKKRIFLWTVGSIIGIILLILLAFRISPWPGAMVIRYEFNKGGVKTLQALEKHQTSKPITVLSNQQYRAKDSKAFLDVYFPAETKQDAALPTVIWTHGGAWG